MQQQEITNHIKQSEN